MGMVLIVIGVCGMIFSIVFGLTQKAKLKKENEKINVELNKIYKI